MADNTALYARDFSTRWKKAQQSQSADGNWSVRRPAECYLQYKNIYFESQYILLVAGKNGRSFKCGSCLTSSLAKSLKKPPWEWKLID